jgi:hypothetical protein
MGAADFHRPGDFNRICDRCGAKRKASDTAKQRDGYIVCVDSCFDVHDSITHPQNHVRGIADKQSVPQPRPEPATDNFAAAVTWDDTLKAYV